MPVPPHVCTPSVSSMPLHVRTLSGEPPTPLHVRTPSKPFPGRTPSISIPPIRSDETMTVAHILAELADGGVEPEPDTEEQVVFEDQTLEEIGIDILVSSVQRPSAVEFKPLTPIHGRTHHVHTQLEKKIVSVPTCSAGPNKPGRTLHVRTHTIIYCFNCGIFSLFSFHFGQIGVLHSDAN